MTHHKPQFTTAIVIFDAIVAVFTTAKDFFFMVRVSDYVGVVQRPCARFLTSHTRLYAVGLLEEVGAFKATPKLCFGDGWRRRCSRRGFVPIK